MAFGIRPGLSPMGASKANSASPVQIDECAADITVGFGAEPYAQKAAELALDAKQIVPTIGEPISPAGRKH